MSPFRRQNTSEWPETPDELGVTESHESPATTVLAKSSEVVAVVADKALGDIERAQGLIHEAATRLANTLLAAEVQVRHHRERMETARASLEEAARDDPVRLDVVRSILDEQIDQATALVGGLEGRVAEAMQLIHFDDMTTQILLGALSRFAQLSESFQSVVHRGVGTEEELFETLEKLKDTLGSNGSVPQQESLDSGEVHIF